MNKLKAQSFRPSSAAREDTKRSPRQVLAILFEPLHDFEPLSVQRRNRRCVHFETRTCLFRSSVMREIWIFFRPMVAELSVANLCEICLQ